MGCSIAGCGFGGWVLVAGLLLCLRLVRLLVTSWFFRLNWLLLLVVRCCFVFGGLVGGCFVIVTVAGVWVLVYVCGVVCGFAGAVDCGVCGCGILFGLTVVLIALFCLVFLTDAVYGCVILIVYGGLVFLQFVVLYSFGYFSGDLLVGLCVGCCGCW